MRDASGVVVMVDDGHLVVAEEAHGLCARKLAERRQVNLVIQVRREDEVLVGARGAALMRLVVASAPPGLVHLVSPFHRVLHGLVVAGHIALVPREIEEVARQGPVSLLQVGLHLLAACMAGDRLDDRDI